MKKVSIITSLLAGAVTPALANNADNFLAHDPIGWMMAVIAMGVVFIALFILFICFKYGYNAINKSINVLFINSYKKAKAKKAERKQPNIKVTDPASGKTVDDAELAAAIGMALFLNEDGMHDKESDVLTLAPSTAGWTGAGNNQKPMPQLKF